MVLANRWLGAAIVLASCTRPTVAPSSGGTATGDGDGPPASTTGGDGTSTGPGMTSVAPDSGASTGAETGSPVPPIDCGEGIVVDGWLHIDGGPDDERESLRGAAVIDGSLVISRSTDTDLDFLACVREVTGSLYLHDNDALTNVHGLRWVEQLGGDLVVTHNDALTEFTGLWHWKDPGEGRSVVFADNGALQRISGLHDLVGVRGDLLLRDNPMLTEIDGLGGLALVLGNLSVNHNPSLCQSKISALATGLELPAVFPEDWTTVGNKEGC